MEFVANEMDSQFFDTAYGRTHVVMEGAGSPVLFLPGRISPLHTWQAWDQNLGAVAAAGFRVVAVELPGYGEAARADGPISSESAVDCLIEACDGLGLASFSIVGYNWGGMLAWRAALIYPKRVARLVLVAAEGAGQLSQSLPGKLKTPTLILWMDADFYLPAAQAGMFAKAIPRAQVEVFKWDEGMSELAARAPQKLGQPFNERLIRFLKE